MKRQLSCNSGTSLSGGVLLEGILIVDDIDTAVRTTAKVWLLHYRIGLSDASQLPVAHHPAVSCGYGPKSQVYSVRHPLSER